METKVQVPAGVTGDFHQDCRECRAGYYQAQRSQLAFLCLEHGTIEYDLTIAHESLSRQRDALLKACEAVQAYAGEAECNEADEPWSQVIAAIQLAREGQDGR